MSTSRCVRGVNKVYRNSLKYQFNIQNIEKANHIITAVFYIKINITYLIIVAYDNFHSV